MLVVADTPVWSLALRRHSSKLNETELHLVDVLSELILEGRVQMLGPIRQEVLSGIREDAVYRKIRDYLRAFDEPRLEVLDYEEAAQVSNRCRNRGIAGSAIDFLVCAAALRRGHAVFTTDQDFRSIASVVPLRLFPA